MNTKLSDVTVGYLLHWIGIGIAGYAIAVVLGVLIALCDPAMNTKLSDVTVGYLLHWIGIGIAGYAIAVILGVTIGLHVVFKAVSGRGLFAQFRSLWSSDAKY